MTNPTLERAARAADPGAWMAHDSDKSWGWAEQRVRQSFETARAVLMAVRDLGGVGGHFWKTTIYLDDDMELFTAMIDAILADGGE